MKEAAEAFESASKREFSAAELADLDGESSVQICIGLAGRVYDVTKRRDLYGKPKGGYSMFAGGVVTRSFAKVSLAKEDLNRCDLFDLEAVHFRLKKH